MLDTMTKVMIHERIIDKLGFIKIKIKIKNTFNSVKEPEPDQEFVVKLKAVLNDSESDISSFTITLHKDYNVWIKI